MASSGGHNFVDYTMHSCKRSILGTGQGIVCILIMGYCHSFYRLLWKKKKKIFFAQTWRGSFFSRLWFILPYHAGDPARYNRTTIYYTLQDRSMGRDARSFFFLFHQLKVFSSCKDNWRSGCARTATLIIVSKTMLLPGAARNSWRRKVSRVLSCWKWDQFLNSVKKGSLRSLPLLIVRNFCFSFRNYSSKI